MKRTEHINVQSFLCTRAPKGNMSAKADGCPAHEQGKMTLPCSIVHTGVQRKKCVDYIEKHVYNFTEKYSLTYERKEEIDMDNTEIAVKLEAHEHEIESLRHRTKDMEQLTISMNRITVSIDSLMTDMEQQSKRIQMLEKIPLETIKLLKTALITAVVSGVVGAILSVVMSAT